MLGGVCLRSPPVLRFRCVASSYSLRRVFLPSPPPALRLRALSAVFPFLGVFFFCVLVFLVAFALSPPCAWPLRGPLVRKTKRQGSSTGAANKQASSPTPLPPPRTRNFCAIAHEHDGVSGPAQCGHDATRGEAKASSAGWSTHCHTHTQSHTPRVRTPPRPRTIGNARSRSRSRKGGESARPILSPAGTPLRALTLLSEERSDGALSAYAPRSHARGRARTYCTVVG